MVRKGRNEPSFTYGPEVTLGPLKPAFPNRLLQAYADINVSPEFLRVAVDEDTIAYFSFPPVRLLTVDMLRWTHITFVLDQIRTQIYPATVARLSHIHLPRIFELITRQRTPGAARILLTGVRGRNIFAFDRYAAELTHTRDPGEREWDLNPTDWEFFALKRYDRVFLVKEEPQAP